MKYEFFAYLLDIRNGLVGLSQNERFDYVREVPISEISFIRSMPHEPAKVRVNMPRASAEFYGFVPKPPQLAQQTHRQHDPLDELAREIIRKNTNSDADRMSENQASGDRQVMAEEDNRFDDSDNLVKY